MSVAALGATLDLGTREAAVAPRAAAELSPRTRALLHGPIVPTLLRMAWPNVLVMVAQAATGLIETWFVSKLGTDALAGMALVFPRRHADANDFRRGHGWRHLVGDRARARARPA